MSYPEVPITGIEQKLFICQVCGKALLSKRDVTVCPVCHTKYVYRRGRMRVISTGSLPAHRVTPPETMESARTIPLSLDGLCEPLPKPWHIRDWFSRTDEELAVLIKQNKQVIDLLEAIAGIAPGVPPALNLLPLTKRLDTLIFNLNRDYPNRLYRVPFDTGDAAWRPLNIHGTGFAITAIGGGFDFRVPSMEGDLHTAVLNGRYDFDFGNIYVSGLGAGNAEITYWRKE